MGKFTKISIAVEYDGKPAFVVIPDDKKEIVELVIMSSCVDETSGKTRLVAAPATFSFTTIDNA